MPEEQIPSERQFVHLHLHTDHSLLQSAIQIKPLAAKLSELGMPACAVTDAGNLYAAITFYNKLREKGIAPIIGYEALLTLGSRHDRTGSVRAGERPYYALVLLAKDVTGYQNLVWLASKAFTEGFHHRPRIDLEILRERSTGLIALSGGENGALNHFLGAGDRARAVGLARDFVSIFGADDFFVELQDHGAVGEPETNGSLAALAAEVGAGIVATNDAFYLNEEDARAHEVLLCIGEGRTMVESNRTRLPSSKYYVRSAAEMWEVFGKDYPEALRNTLAIAERCRIELPLGDSLTLPRYPIPADSGCDTTDAYFEKVVLEGFEGRAETVWNPMAARGDLRYTLEEYRQRIAREIEMIKSMGFPGYFLIVWEFIEYAKRRGIPVGPGRGSAAGSLVAYCLGITDVDPLQYDLLFERFLNPERISMPDIDIDFCVRGRAEVINHVTEFYGRESVCQIITFGTMASKAAIKDVGRALNMPYGEVERVAKLIPPPVRGRNVSITQAIEQVAELRTLIETDEQVRDLVGLARVLEGCARHSSVHAAGVVISPKPLHEIVPVAKSDKAELTSQYTMGDLEAVGMLKMDFLALTTLTVINDCLSNLKAKRGIEIDWSEVPLNDPPTMQLFGDGRTEAIFQFESSGMQEICRRLKPKELEDLAALNALYRPGPLDGGMVDDFIARHRGEKKVRYILPEMEEILKNTFGILVYQEQIMQLAQKLAGYSLGEADMMRRAMGKKKREEMAKHEQKFISGAVLNNVPKEKAEEIFKLMAQFADYGFNRSHSVAYAYLAFQTAYLKAHYPAYFYASVLSHEAQDSAKVYKYSKELRAAGLELLPPDINESDEGFTPLEGAVRFGLTAIKGIGTASVQAMIEARKSGPFRSIIDFVERLEPGTVNRKGMESLVTAGAFDTLRPGEIQITAWRARLHAGIEKALAHGQAVAVDRQAGQAGLFGADTGGLEADWRQILPEAREWTMAELSGLEKAAVGFYLSTHPLDEHAAVLDALGIGNIGDREDLSPGARLTVAGIVSALQVKHSKKGNRFCVFRLDDQSGGVKCLVWAETYGRCSAVLRDGEILVVEGKVESNEGGEVTVIVEHARSVADALPAQARGLTLTLPGDGASADLLDRLLSMLSREQGRCELVIDVPLGKGAVARVEVPPLRIQGSGKLGRELEETGCKVKWIL